MDAGLVQPGLKSDAVLDGVHEWLTLKARRYRSRVIPLDWLGLIDMIARERAYKSQEVSDSLTTLLDLEWIEKVDRGDGFRVLVEKTPPELSARRFAPSPERVSVAAERRSGRATSASEPTFASGASERRLTALSFCPDFSGGPVPKAPESPVVTLARVVFPNLCRQGGILILPRQMDWRPLAKNLKQWQIEYGISFSRAEEMMEEFARHPGWCRGSTPPWRIFLARREKLLMLLETRHQRDPGRFRAGQSEQDWRRSSDPGRHTRGAESWLRRA